MIAIGTPFIELLTKNNLTLTQYCVLYCYAYDKVHLLEKYFKENKFEIECVQDLITKKYLYSENTTCIYELANKKALADLLPTTKCIQYIKDLVDSYADMKSENILSDDEELFDLIEDIYKKEFKLFHDTYPITTIRKNGFKASLRENKKQCKQLYIQILKDKKITSSMLQKCLEYYIAEKKKGGDIAYLKTMKNFLKDETWRDVKEQMKLNVNKTDVDYGGKLI
jgi:hypothetical protein